jgi:hypothetical protein
MKKILTDYGIERDNLTFNNIWTIIRNSVFIDINNVTLQSILEIDLPNVNKDIEDCATYLDILDFNLDIYERLYNSTKSFYMTNGDVRSMKYYNRFELN